MGSSSSKPQPPHRPDRVLPIHRDDSAARPTWHLTAAQKAQMHANIVSAHQKSSVEVKRANGITPLNTSQRTDSVKSTSSSGSGSGSSGSGSLSRSNAFRFRTESEDHIGQASAKFNAFRGDGGGGGEGRKTGVPARQIWGNTAPEPAIFAGVGR